MINWLFCQFHSHLLVNDNLSANLCDGLLDSAAFLDSVGCREAAMEQLSYSGYAVNVLVLVIFLLIVNDVLIGSLDKLDELNTTHFSNCLF